MIEAIHALADVGQLTAALVALASLLSMTVGMIAVIRANPKDLPELITRLGKWGFGPWGRRKK